MSEWRKAIPESRDRLQSKLLVGAVGTSLTVFSSLLLVSHFTQVSEARMKTYYHANADQLLRALLPEIISLTFATLVWAVHAATPGGIFCGSLICFLVIEGTEPAYVWRSGLVPLIALFVLTFASTRAGRPRKLRFGVAEDRDGRTTSQVIANLGMAGLTAIVAMAYASFKLNDWRPGISPWIAFADNSPVALLAALCEATADTVSSEIGQAFGGRPVLLTSLRRVDPGTDGAITLLGTAAGVLAAAIVAAVGMASMSLPLFHAAVAFTGGIAGLFFDSLLGATVERKGWLGNDLVNFSSTLFAALVALLLLLFTHN